ncbi:hypothetical protein KIN20_017243 [Parelaphostrongylus tenuis]|uniref:Uncharacterized protein n=1 Tax=Parelaphostrongylus tenuis TaxID=148309 RepID=A0AAD5MMZ1_PARTN|nr:hypothetical protein KIN20_017243 [Parelaphostrongylus tenuis]
MTRRPANPSAISLLATFSAVLGCGVMPARQVGIRTFTVTGFTLPVAMVYSTEPTIQAQVFDVLESQARSALLPDAVLSAILGQHEVTITYEPLQCQGVILNMMIDKMMMNERKCIIIDNTVTGICTTMERMVGGVMCENKDTKKIELIPSNHTSILGTLSTTNIIMTNWSKAMWQNIVSRAIRMLALGPLGSHFFSASVSVGGN